MLSLGGTSWRVTPVGSSQSAAEARAEAHLQADNTAAPAPAAGAGAGAYMQDDPTAHSAAAAAAGAAARAVRRPCPVSYLHVRASRGKETAVRIPPAASASVTAPTATGSPQLAWLWACLTRLAEAYMSPLSPASAYASSRADHQARTQAQARVQVPLHLTVEPLLPFKGAVRALGDLVGWWLAAPAPTPAHASSPSPGLSSDSGTSTPASILSGLVLTLVLVPALLQSRFLRAGAGAERSPEVVIADWTILGLVRRVGSVVQRVGAYEAEEEQ